MEKGNTQRGLDRPRQKPGIGRILALIGFPLLIATIFVPVVIFRREIWAFFTSSENLRAWVSARGALAPLVFMAIQALQVIVFIIPGEVPQIAGGYLFGVWLGALYSAAGILIGSAVSFFLSRLLGVPFVNALFKKEQVEKVMRFLDSRRSRFVFFLLFLIPGIPKDILCYVAGISPMRFPFFLAASFAGRLPGILGSAIIGNAAAGQKWLLTGIVGAIALLFFGAGLILRTRIESWVERISRKGRGSAGSVDSSKDRHEEPGKK